MKETAGRVLGRGWGLYRSWPWWVQLLIFLAFVGGISQPFQEEDASSARVTSAMGEVSSDSSPLDEDGGEERTTADEEEEEVANEAASIGEAKFRATGVSWEAYGLAELKVMFTVKNTGSAPGRIECFVEVDATDLLDECFGECGAQDLLSGGKLKPGQKIRTFGMLNIEGGAAPAVYDVDVLC